MFGLLITILQVIIISDFLSHSLTFKKPETIPVGSVVTWI